jgi:hypothetical protein
MAVAATVTTELDNQRDNNNNDTSGNLEDEVVVVAAATAKGEEELDFLKEAVDALSNLEVLDLLPPQRLILVSLRQQKVCSLNVGLILVDASKNLLVTR